MSSIDIIEDKKSHEKAFVIAWAFGCVFYFMEYVARSSPAVMISQFSDFWGISALQVSSVLGKYYYTYSITSLIAGIALDRFGGKFSISLGAGILAIGCALFAAPSLFTGDIGRLLQGAGSAFAFTGCVYLASHGFSPNKIATAIGFTQCMGMLGGSAGQFVVGPLIHGGMHINIFWIAIGVVCGVVALMIYTITPSEYCSHDHPARQNLLLPYKIVFTNVQSYLSGLISGLLFAPTTIFAMTWGVAFFQQDRHFNYESAVLICSMAPMGWVVGCPVMGWISDKIGRRKPVLSMGIILMLVFLAQVFLLPDLLPPGVSLFLFGIASGVAMIPYTIIKEANPDNVKGSATGGINFITFGITAILGPLFASMYGKTLQTATDHLAHYQGASTFFLLTTAIAFIASLIIKETGKGVAR